MLQLASQPKVNQNNVQYDMILDLTQESDQPPTPGCLSRACTMMRRSLGSNAMIASWNTFTGVFLASGGRLGSAVGGGMTALSNAARTYNLHADQNVRGAALMKNTAYALLLSGVNIGVMYGLSCAAAHHV